jgi:hypothetical protein
MHYCIYSNVVHDIMLRFVILHFVKIRSTSLDLQYASTVQYMGTELRHSYLSRNTAKRGNYIQ